MGYPEEKHYGVSYLGLRAHPNGISCWYVLIEIECVHSYWLYVLILMELPDPLHL